MNKTSLNYILNGYKKFLPYGAGVLILVWLIALATVMFLPGPYKLDFFGVVAERTATSSSATIGVISIVTALVFVPFLMIAIDHYKKH